MVTVDEPDLPKDFAHAFGDALNSYLQRTGMGQSEVARLLGIEAEPGEKRKGGARIYSYCRDNNAGKRTAPKAEILYLACTKLPGFSFSYNGYRINAEVHSGNGTQPSEPPPEQLLFEFERQFNLTRKQGMVAVRVKQPPGRIEVSVSLNARAS